MVASRPCQPRPEKGSRHRKEGPAGWYVRQTTGGRAVGTKTRAKTKAANGEDKDNAKGKRAMAREKKALALAKAQARRMQKWKQVREEQTPAQEPEHVLAVKAEAKRKARGKAKARCAESSSSTAASSSASTAPRKARAMKSRGSTAPSSEAGSGDDGAITLTDETPIAALLPKTKRLRVAKDVQRRGILDAMREDSIADRIRRMSRVQPDRLMLEAEMMYPSGLHLPDWAENIVDFFELRLRTTPPIDVVVNTWSDCAGALAILCTMPA